MYIPYDEFEKVMAQCSELFTTWDDEYDKLQVCIICTLYIWHVRP